jgi:serine/threonine-protein kinase Chk2
MSKNGKGKDYEKEEEAYEQTKLRGIASGGYLIGRHPECGEYFNVVC